MWVVVNGARMVSKESRQWDDGTFSYQATFSNGHGELCRVNVQQEDYNMLVPFDVAYDMELDVTTRGYKTYVDLVTMAEQ